MLFIKTFSSRFFINIYYLKKTSLNIKEGNSLLDKNVIKNFISNFDRQASFSVMITDIQQEHKCNKDILTLQTQYINPNLFTIIKNQSDLIDEISQASNMEMVRGIINNYDNLATKVSQVINRKLTIQSELVFDETTNLFLSKLNGYENLIDDRSSYKTNLSGTIINGVSKVISPDFPSKITFNDIRIKDNLIQIKIRYNINNIVLTVDDTEYNGTIENNIFTATVNNIQTGSHTFNIDYDLEEELITKNIEMAITELNKIIDFDFNKNYTNLPCLYITLDDNFSNLYSTYTTNFKVVYKCKNCNHIEEGYLPFPDCSTCGSSEFDIIEYTGVRIKFKNLKKKSKYPKINITVIGGKYNDTE